MRIPWHLIMWAVFYAIALVAWFTGRPAWFSGVCFVTALVALYTIKRPERKEVKR